MVSPVEAVTDLLLAVTEQVCEEWSARAPSQVFNSAQNSAPGWWVERPRRRGLPEADHTAGRVCPDEHPALPESAGP